MAISRKHLELGPFLRQYARKTHRGMDPNDRSYDRKIEQAVKAMTPEAFDALVRDEGGADDDWA